MNGIYSWDSDEEPQVYDGAQLEAPDIIEATNSGSLNGGTENLNVKEWKVKVDNWK